MSSLESKRRLFHFKKQDIEALRVGFVLACKALTRTPDAHKMSWVLVNAGADTDTTEIKTDSLMMDSAASRSLTAG
ncbi:9170_t:CDS:2 [Paraglomus occultum]|uniref:9170_t:CDS:1 n=1 Tax=Paraglomus occultum TaxID=144539 RepID=A0A9N8WB87_9GLOM|nr:9170_t:CDS:2 [Paraglomus occultum]